MAKLKPKKTVTTISNDQRDTISMIIAKLQKAPNGLKELDLYGKFDPTMVIRMLEVLERRGTIEMIIADDQVGASRRQYRLKRG